jgi:hypothetical protein
LAKNSLLNFPPKRKKGISRLLAVIAYKYVKESNERNNYHIVHGVQEKKLHVDEEQKDHAGQAGTQQVLQVV